VINNSHKWILLENNKFVSGLYYENVNSGRIIMRLGVVGGSPIIRTAPLLPQYDNCDIPSPLIGGPNAGLFLLVAALSNLQRVDVCRVNDCYPVMFIYYFDGYTAILGQWQIASVSCYSCIYNNSRPSITDIYFRVSKSGDYITVTNIGFLLNISKAISTCEYRVFIIRDIKLHTTLAILAT